MGTATPQLLLDRLVAPQVDPKVEVSHQAKVHSLVLRRVCVHHHPTRSQGPHSTETRRASTAVLCQTMNIPIHLVPQHLLHRRILSLLQVLWTEAVQAASQPYDQGQPGHPLSTNRVFYQHAIRQELKPRPLDRHAALRRQQETAFEMGLDEVGQARMARAPLGLENRPRHLENKIRPTLWTWSHHLFACTCPVCGHPKILVALTGRGLTFLHKTFLLTLADEVLSSSSVGETSPTLLPGKELFYCK